MTNTTTTPSITVDNTPRTLAWVDHTVRHNGGAPTILPDGRAIDTDHLVWDTVERIRSGQITTTTDIAAHIADAIDTDPDATWQFDADGMWGEEIRWQLQAHSHSRFAADSEWLAWADSYQPNIADHNNWEQYSQACADAATAAIEDWLVIDEPHSIIDTDTDTCYGRAPRHLVRHHLLTNGSGMMLNRVDGRWQITSRPGEHTIFADIILD